MSTSVLNYALRYADQGWKVFPCKPREKTPLTPHGVKDATDDRDQIIEWWKQWPDANVAVACGKSSGVYVVDVDVDNERGIDGYKSLEEFPRLPDSVRQATPRGGFHIFYRTANPPANKNSFRPGIDIRGDGYYVILAPSVHPNGGQYAWAPGRAPWEFPLAEFPDFLRPATRVPWQAPPAPPVALPSFQEPASDDVLRRASAYVRIADPSRQGENGHGNLLRVAVALVHGFLLSDQQTWEILAREFNPRCVPPWDLGSPKDHRDFSRKVSEARKLTPDKPAGWLLDSPEYLPSDPAAVERGKKIAEALLQAPEPQPPIRAVEEPKLLLHQPAGEVDLRLLTEPTGLVGRICAWINRTSMQPQPLLTLGCVLAFCGALFGRKVRTPDGVRTNLYSMGIAVSCAGKEHARTQIRRLAAAAGCENLIGGSGLASDSALEQRIAREPATLFLFDEIGHFMAGMKSGKNQYTAQIVPLLMALYSSAKSAYTGREYAEKEKQCRIVQPCCCLYGTSTPARFLSALSPEELHDGWLSRCLVFQTPTDPEVDDDVIEEPVPGELVESVRAWGQRPIVSVTNFDNVAKGIDNAQIEPEPLVVPYTDDARLVFRAIYKESRAWKQQYEELGSLWGRAWENAKKLALIVAAGNSFEAPTITAQDAHWACQVIRFLLTGFTAEARKIVSGEVGKNKQKITEFISRSGVEGLPGSPLARKAYWLKKPERDVLLLDLEEAGEIVSILIPGRAHGKRYWTPENYQKWLKKQK